MVSFINIFACPYHFFEPHDPDSPKQAPFPLCSGWAVHVYDDATLSRGAMRLGEPVLLFNPEQSFSS